jgi:hypothetical protein
MVHVPRVIAPSLYAGNDLVLIAIEVWPNRISLRLAHVGSESFGDALPRLQLSDDRGTRYEMHEAAVGGTGTENLAELHYVPTVPPDVSLLTVEAGEPPARLTVAV